jgi:hypothetical protein
MTMAEKRTARKARHAGKAYTTQAGRFVREEVHKIRRGEHGAKSPQQAIAIGLSKARRAGVALAPPREGRAKERTRRSAEYAYGAGQHKRKAHRRPRVARAESQVLKRELRSTASRADLSRQAARAASQRTASERSSTARKAVEDSERVRLMALAFDRVLNLLPCNVDRTEEMRREVALYIVDQFRLGEHDPDRLSDLALARLAPSGHEWLWYPPARQPVVSSPRGA